MIRIATPAFIEHGSCASTGRAYAHDISPDVLTGGEWVFDPRARVMRWVPAEPVACLACGATASQSCVTSSGAPRHSHPVRSGPRLCPCGATLKPRARYCPPCRYAANLASKRSHYQRTKEAA